MRLEAVAIADNPQPNSYIWKRALGYQGKWHSLYHKVCTSRGRSQIPRELHGRNTTWHNITEIFVDSISYMITSAGSPIHCNDVAPPHYNLSGKWYCSYPELRELYDSAMLPVEKVQTESLRTSDICRFGEKHLPLETAG
jgi:hypothetical protein